MRVQKAPLEPAETLELPEASVAVVEVHCLTLSKGNLSLKSAVPILQDGWCIQAWELDPDAPNPKP